MADFQHSSQQLSINVMVGIWHLAEENLDWNDDGYALAWQHTLQLYNKKTVSFFNTVNV